MVAGVYLEVALSGEGSAAYFAFERPFAGVGPVVHLQGAFARQNSMADDALVGIHQFIFNVIHQLLQFRRLRRPRHFDQRLPGVVVGARTREEVGVDGRILGRINVAASRRNASAMRIWRSV